MRTPLLINDKPRVDQDLRYEQVIGQSLGSHPGCRNLNIYQTFLSITENCIDPISTVDLYNISANAAGWRFVGNW